MGKTKTAVIGDIPEEKLTGKAAYEAKKKKQEAAKKAREADKKKGAVSKVGLKGGERIKVIGGDISEEEKKADAKKEAGEERAPKVRSKKYKSAVAKVDKSKLYSISEAIKLVKETSYSKFDGTVELHLGVKKDGLTAAVELPHFSGKAKKVEVASSKTIDKLKKGKIDFDVLLATSDMMPKLVPFAKLLGPKGLMPNPKNGTIIKTKADAKKFPGNTINIKTERKAPLIHVAVGKVNQKESELEENIKSVISAVSKNQIKKAHLAATMSPSVKISI